MICNSFTVKCSENNEEIHFLLDAFDCFVDMLVALFYPQWPRWFDELPTYLIFLYFFLSNPIERTRKTPGNQINISIVTISSPYFIGVFFIFLLVFFCSFKSWSLKLGPERKLANRRTLLNFNQMRGCLLFFPPVAAAIMWLNLKHLWAVYFLNDSVISLLNALKWAEEIQFLEKKKL